MYDEFYGLTEKPFELVPDPTFLFFTPSHRETVAFVIDGIRNRRGFISFTGGVGTGKTTLTRFLLGKLETEEKIKTVLIFHPTITFKELLNSILLELDLKVTDGDKKVLWDQLNEYLTHMIIRGETLVVIIDEAQDLPMEVMEELGMLPEIETLQIVFVGQHEFEDKLDSQGLRQLKQKIGIKCQIRALSEEESKNYIDHRLRLVMSSSSQIFTPEAISLICSHAQGIPRIINVLSDNAFLIGYSLSRKKIDADIICEVIKNIEGTSSKKIILSEMMTALREFYLLLIRLRLSPKKASLAILSLLCLGGLILLTQSYLRQRPAKTWNVESFKSVRVDTQPSSTSLSLQETKERNLKGKRYNPIDIFSESGQPINFSFASASPISEWSKFREVVTVEKGQSLYYLAQKYYSMANPTLVALILDFNPEITNANAIMVNQKIKLPKITKEIAIIQSTDHTYKIHVGTYRNPAFVRFYSKEPVLKGKKIEVFPRKVSPKDIWYRIVVGPFGHKDECLEVIDQLREKELLSAFGGILKKE